MKGIVRFVDISQLLPLPLAESVRVHGDNNHFPKRSKPLDATSSWWWSSEKLCHRTPTGRVKKQASSSSTATASANTESEIRVCVNRTCRRQGSMETLNTLSGIAPPHVFVKSCGCLGRCGAGPNLVVLPQSTFVAHCGTPARAAQVMFDLCGGDSDSWTNSLAALALRTRADNLLGNVNNGDNNNFSEAELLLSQAIDLKPFGGIHTLYKDRSALRLTMGNMVKALEDAKEAVTLAPKYTEAYICQGDVLMAMDHLDSAEKSYAKAVELDPSVRRSKSFRLYMYITILCEVSCLYYFSVPPVWNVFLFERVG